MTSDLNHALTAHLLKFLKERDVDGLIYSSGLKDGKTDDSMHSIEAFANFAVGAATHYVHCLDGYIKVFQRFSNDTDNTSEVGMVVFDMADPNVFENVANYIKNSSARKQINRNN